MDRREMFLQTVRNYLAQKNIQYTEYESATGSTYFVLDYFGLHPQIRISDHPTRRTNVVSLIYTYGKWTSVEKVKKRIVRTIDNKLRKANIAIVHRIMGEVAK